MLTMLGADGGVTTVLGLPLHPLVVHAVVVLIPLVTAAVLVMAVSPTWRDRLRWPVLLLLVVVAGAGALAKESGEQLLVGLGGATGGTLTRHADLGNLAPLVVAPFVLVTGAWLLLDLRAARRGEGRGLLVTVLAVLSVLVAVGATVWVVWVGHSGATAVWQPVVNQLSR